jgi:hypothetical protein
VQESENRPITDIGIVHTTGHALLVPAVERHADASGRYHGLPQPTVDSIPIHKGVQRIEAIGVARAAEPKTGSAPLHSSSANENAPFEKRVRGVLVAKPVFQDSRTH